MTPRVFKASAERLLENGYSPVPLWPGTGHPAVKHLAPLREDPLSMKDVAGFARRHSDLGLAVVGKWNGLVPVDVDTTDPEVIDAIVDALPKPNVARVGSKGWVAFYFDPTGKIRGRNFTSPELGPLVEVKVNGMVTIPPSRHVKTGLPYEWSMPANLFGRCAGELVHIAEAHFDRLGANLSRWLRKPRVYVPAQPPTETRVSDRRMAACARAILQRQVSVLAAMQPESGRNRALYDAMCVLGKFIHHGAISEAEVRNELMKCCVANGLVRDTNARQCLQTIASGLKKSANDPRPVLRDRPKAAQRV